jgi:pimeloyl-ACP methyl ester carboxylesterase
MLAVPQEPLTRLSKADNVLPIPGAGRRFRPAGAMMEAAELPDRQRECRMPGVTTNDGVTLNYLDEGSGPTIVLLAGYTAPASSWALQGDALVSAGFRAIAVDRRSHGSSDSPMFGQRMSRHGKDLADVLAALDLRDVVLVGGSMGANVGWAYLDLFGIDLVRGIVSVDQTPKMINTPEWPYGFYGLDDANVGTFFADGIPPTGRGLPPERSMAGVPRLIERLGAPPEFRSPLAPETVWLLRDHAIQDWRDVARRADVPVLMVAGRDSQLWPCEHAAATAADNPLSRAVVIDDCGHGVTFDQPDAFNDHLLAFLRDL